MTGDMNKQPDEAQPSAPEQPQYRKVSEEELKRILKDHHRWFQTKGTKGTRANLHEASLRSANLQAARSAPERTVEVAARVRLPEKQESATTMTCCADMALR